MKLVWEWERIFWNWGLGFVRGVDHIENKHYSYKHFDIGPLSIQWSRYEWWE
jgi:hypothetical protein